MSKFVFSAKSEKGPELLVEENETGNNNETGENGVHDDASSGEERGDALSEELDDVRSPWSGFARSKRLSLHTQRNVNFIRANTNAVIDKVISSTTPQAPVEKTLSKTSSFSLSDRVSDEFEDTRALLNSLPEITHHVIKHGRLRRKMKRLLILKSHCIVNAKPNGEETKTFLYEDIVDAMLVKHDRLRLQFKNYHDLYYHSALAPQVHSDIHVRLEICRVLAKKEEQLNIIQKVAGHMETWGVGGSAKFRRQETASPATKAGVRATNTGSPGSNQLPGQDREKNRRKSRIELLAGVAEDSLENQVRMYVQTLIHNESTDEGRTRFCFVENANELFARDAVESFKTGGSQVADESDEAARISLLVKPLVTLRQFVDGMRDYIMEHHAAKFEELVASDIFLDPTKTDTTDGGISTVSRVVTKCAEESIVQVLSDKIFRAVDAIVTHDAAASWSQRYSILCSKSQSFFNIKKEFQCNQNWHSAVTACTDLTMATFPSDKLEALMETARCIYERFGELQPKITLGADDFVPIFMFVLSRARADRAMHDCVVIAHLCPELMLSGECTYYMSTFEAAVAYMAEMNLDGDGGTTSTDE